MDHPIRQFRTEKDMSLAALAEKVGRTKTQLSRWETGQRRIPAELVPKLSTLTGIPPHELRPDIYPAPETPE